MFVYGSNCGNDIHFRLGEWQMKDGATNSVKLLEKQRQFISGVVVKIGALLTMSR